MKGFGTVTIRPSDPSEQARRPDACPFCGCRAVGTLAKQITTATYWRCQGCGEGWNVAQLALSKATR
jgi:hypothetical protein